MTAADERREQYDSREHREGRAAALATAKPTDSCPRCGLALGRPINSDRLDYDHNGQRTGYLGLSHRSCNRRAGAEASNRAQALARDGYVPARAW